MSETHLEFTHQFAPSLALPTPVRIPCRSGLALICSWSRRVLPRPPTSDRRQCDALSHEERFSITEIPPPNTISSLVKGIEACRQIHLAQSAF
jgi:hypothetical protein